MERRKSKTSHGIIINCNEEKQSYYSLEPREALAFDLNNLRNIYKEDGLYKEIVPHLREYAKEAREDYYKEYLTKKK